MRLWSLHPGYLDARGLVACWREGLLARKVLLGNTKGYQHHPQLERFRAQADPVAMIDAYLYAIYEEAQKRGYQFDRTKIRSGSAERKIAVTTGQLRYELNHLKHKLEKRDPGRYVDIANLTDPEPHPLFRVVSGGVEAWERLSPVKSPGK